MADNHIMVDLETLGTSTNALILSIGAVKFDPHRADIPMEKFHVAIDMEDAEKCGLKIDASTVKWWMQPDRHEARAQYLKQQMHSLTDALDGFAQWCGTSVKLWGNGATFDNVILRRAYETCKWKVPWQFYNDRCYRSLKALAKDIPVERVGTHHDALHDAISQARHMQQIVKALRLKVS